jgi:hypothetical protein
LRRSTAVTVLPSVRSAAFQSVIHFSVLGTARKRGVGVAHSSGRRHTDVYLGSVASAHEATASAPRPHAMRNCMRSDGASVSIT